MKKLLFLVLSIILLPSVAFAAQSKTCGNLNLKTNLPNFKYSVVKKTPIGSGLCQVIVSVSTPQGNQAVPVYANPKFAIIGQLFKDKADVTQLVLTAYRAKAVKSALTEYKPELDKAVAAEYVPKNPDGKVLYAFEDPLCPFCDMMKPHMLKLANESGWTIKLIWDIVHGKPAFDMATRLVCNHFTYANYLKYKSTAQDPLSKGKGCMSGIKKVKLDEHVSSEFQISGTPTFITSTGQEIIGDNLQMLKSVMGVK